MTRRVPILATLVVVAAVATMIWLGVWQLQRRAEKDALLALYRANLGKPAVSFPILPPVADEMLFRRSSLVCLEVGGWQMEGGRAADGSTGYRHIARCRTGAEGPGALVDMGLAADPKVKPVWNGGPVSGTITTAPSHESALGRLLGGGGAPRVAMLVSATPAPGLKASAPPSTDNVPNNHLAYAFQWFFFAAVALVIYVLALRRRNRRSDAA